MIQPLWITDWHFPKKLNINLPRNTTIHFYALIIEYACQSKAMGPSQVQKDSTHRGAAEPRRHNCRAHAAYSPCCAPQQEEPQQREARTLQLESGPAHHNQRKPEHSNEDSEQPIIKIKKLKSFLFFPYTVPRPTTLSLHATSFYPQEVKHGTFPHSPTGDPLHSSYHNAFSLFLPGKKGLYILEFQLIFIVKPSLISQDNINEHNPSFGLHHQHKIC